MPTSLLLESWKAVCNSNLLLKHLLGNILSCFMSSFQLIYLWSPSAVHKYRFGCITLYCSAVDVSPSPQSHFTICSPECATDEEFFLQALCEEDSEDDYADADPVVDDLYFRRVQLTLHQTSTNLHYDCFLPQYWTPEEEVRVRRIYLGSQRRPWYHKMLSLRSVYFFLL